LPFAVLEIIKNEAANGYSNNQKAERSQQET
jgi:hypothetical protein